MELSQKHKDFINLVSNGSEQDKAYMVTVGNNKVTSATARVKGSQLAKKYAKQIELERKRISDIVNHVKDGELAENAYKDVLSKADRMKFLSGLVTTDSEKIFTGDKIKAVAELNKMDGSYAPTKVESDNKTTISWSEEKVYDTPPNEANKAANKSN
jgi:hypothetical protein